MVADAVIRVVVAQPRSSIGWRLVRFILGNRGGSVAWLIMLMTSPRHAAARLMTRFCIFLRRRPFDHRGRYQRSISNRVYGLAPGQPPMNWARRRRYPSPH